MASIYITENGTYLHKRGGKLLIDKEETTITEVPLELVENITVTNTTQISSSLITECLTKNIPVSWMSTSGKMYGSLLAPSFVDIFKQKQQFDLIEEKDFYFKLAQKIVSAKIHNQLVLLRRYNRNIKSEKVHELINYLANTQKNIKYTSDNNELLGYEGLASRTYFSALGMLINKPFQFTKRTKQPPRDPFNTMLSMGYSILFNEILSNIIAIGLHPYIGFFHQLAKGHPALVSDLIEEWRAVIVDALVISLIKRGSITENMFTLNKKGCYFSPEGKKIFLNAYNKKINTENKYISGEHSYRDSLRIQCQNYAQAISNKNINIYTPIKLNNSKGYYLWMTNNLLS